MTKDEQIASLYAFLRENYNEVRKKYKQMAFLAHITYSDDVLNDTVVKVIDKIQRDGIKAENDKEVENYFFRAFKLNTLQEHQQEQKRAIDDNLELQDLELFADDEYDETDLQFNDFVKRFLEIKIKEHFDDLYFCVYRLRYFIAINGKSLNFKDIKRITGVKSTKKIISDINRYIKDNYPIEYIKREYQNNAKKYFK